MAGKINRNRVLLAATVVWVSSIAVGHWSLAKYQTTPGSADDRPKSWPVNHGVQLTRERVNVVMLAHPRCPCTRASLVQLGRLFERCPDKITAHIFFWKPSGAGDDWTQTNLRRQAMTLPDVQIHTDEDGAEARRLGASTSGHVVIFRGDGTWLFGGGLTDSRGDESDSHAVASVEKLIAGNLDEASHSRVFGCPLDDSKAACLKGTDPCLK